MITAVVVRVDAKTFSFSSGCERESTKTAARTNTMFCEEKKKIIEKNAIHITDNNRFYCEPARRRPLAVVVEDDFVAKIVVRAYQHGFEENRRNYLIQSTFSITMYMFYEI